MKIGLIGTGRMATGLAGLWSAHKHALFFGSRDLARAETAAEACPGAGYGSYRDAADFADVLFLGLPWHAVDAALETMGELDGQILIDPTNPIAPDRETPVIGPDPSAAERIAERARGAWVVKAFNTIHYRNLNRPRIAGQRVSVFYCGDDRYAKDAVSLLITELGFDAVDCGPLLRARLLEPLALLWVRLAAGGLFPTESGFAFLREGEAVPPIMEARLEDGALD